MGRTLLSIATAFLILSPTFSSPFRPPADPTPLPLVIWHGLGDDFDRDGLKQIAKLADYINPGTYVHIISLGNTPSADREATFLGNVTSQVDQVCEELATEPIISTAPAINALGFSQGGQFLRAYTERCNYPPVHNLVTFGSQHNGISKFQSCDGPGDWLCWAAEALLRFGRWSDTVQSRFVPAQYFRDPEELEDYLEHSNFLADVNNEREVKNKTYKQNLIKLNKFVMFMFEDDVTMVPKESAHFIEVNGTTGERTALQDRPMYKEDWLGLKTLDEQGKLEFLTIPGQHMELTHSVLEDTFTKYFGPIENENDGPAFVVQGGP